VFPPKIILLLETTTPKDNLSKAESYRENFHNPNKGYIATLFDSMEDGIFPESISFLSTAEPVGKGSFGDFYDFQ